MSYRKYLDNWHLEADHDPADPLVACQIRASRSGKSAFHENGSVLWRVTSGGGFVIFQHVRSGTWILGYLWEDDRWLARKRHPYFFVGHLEPFKLEALCYREDASGQNMVYPDVPQPEEAYVYVEGEVEKTEPGCVDILRHGICARYPLHEWDDPSLDQRAPGKPLDFCQEVKIKILLSSLQPDLPILYLATPSWLQLDIDMCGDWPDEEPADCEEPGGGMPIPRRRPRQAVIEAIKRARQYQA